MRTPRLIGAALILGLTALVGVGIWRTSDTPRVRRTLVVRRHQRVMGTTCAVAAVTGVRDRARAERAVAETEAVLRRAEAGMSVRLSDSVISRLNAAAAYDEVRLPSDVLDVLRAAHEAARNTNGAFDITIEPLLALWRRAGERGVQPTQSEVDDARSASRWDMIELTETGATKRATTARVDLGGIAKGYAIDRALESLQDAGLVGGMVDVGGDLRCFGSPPESDRWSVEIRNPSGEGTLATLMIEGGAVCTSGNYARFTVIGDQRFSHVIDPRTGWPADAAPSVTVIAPKATTADIWATALSVLGLDGLALLPKGTHALIVAGDSDDARVICTPRLRRLLRELPRNLTVWKGQANGAD